MKSSIDAISALKLQSSNKVTANKESDGGDFLSILKDSIAKVNNDQIEADRAMGDIATGSVKDLHQAAIAINKAELSMKMMLEVRNKALNAYKEILKTQM